jgi:UDP-N-acetylmuramoyl-tripeptide--D-alanyl-D-alanine ligase
MQLQNFYRDIFLKHSVISTDTRKIDSGCLYFALKGNNFNGNYFAEDALNKGASFAIIDDKSFKKSDQYILVNDVLLFLQNLAHYHRIQFSLPILAIGGSNGKTTTKELVKSVLEKKYNVLATEGNFNNHIGVPLTLLKLNAIHEIAVIEIGANHAKEHEFLCTLVEPDYVLITNNGKDHLEGFGSIEGVIAANGEIYDYARAHHKQAFVPFNEYDLLEMSKDLKRLIYGEIGAEIAGSILSEFPTLQLEIEDKLIIKSNLFGAYNFNNVMAAVAVGKYFEVSNLAIAQAIGNYQPKLNRSQIVENGSNTFVYDCYNANPSSMMAALKSFIKINHSAKWIVLGDMLELGETSESEHLSILQFCANHHFEKRIYIGKIFYSFRNQFDGNFFENNTDATNFVALQKIENKLILLKGSRGIAVEKIFQ